jgi:hypothetical protein
MELQNLYQLLELGSYAVSTNFSNIYELKKIVKDWEEKKILSNLKQGNVKVASENIKTSTSAAEKMNSTNDVPIQFNKPNQVTKYSPTKNKQKIVLPKRRK